MVLVVTKTVLVLKNLQGLGLVGDGLNYITAAKTKLIEAIMRIWYPEDEVQYICSILVDSMPTRISMIIYGKGGRIKN